MPVSRTNRNRRAKALRYAAKDACYQRKLRQYREAKALGYSEPRYPPAGGKGDYERRRAVRSFGRPRLFRQYAPTR